MYRDLREWLQRVEAMGELVTVRGADWNLEIAAITEIARGQSPLKPALLFDEIKGYPQGFRVLTGMMTTIRRLGLIMNVQAENERDFVRLWRERLKTQKAIPSRLVKDGPILENVLEGDQIDMWKFPTPLWHEQDGGRYIGTASVTITRDPDKGWVNLGTYRVMVHDRDKVGFYASPGKHGRIHREMLFSRGEPCQVAVSFGHDPALFVASTQDYPWGQSEYDVAGAIKGEPIDVIAGEFTGLPIPAHSEIVIEGEALPDEKLAEGPFGEFTGYYASGQREEPVIRVKRLYHRHNPIITGASPSKPPADYTLHLSCNKSAGIWNLLEGAGLPGIQAVYQHPVGANYFYLVISIKQLYPGHAKQAAMMAASVPGGAYMGRYIIVVDDDIDAFNMDDVLWAMSTRVDPAQDIDIIRRAWSGPLDPTIPHGAPGLHSIALVDATRPWEWKDQFPPAITFDPAYMEATTKRWGKLLGI